MSTSAGRPCFTRGWARTAGFSPSSSLITWARYSPAALPASETPTGGTLGPPAGVSKGCSHTFRTIRSAPWSAASAAAQDNALRLPRDPSTPTRTVFQVFTVVSSSSIDAPALKDAQQQTPAMHSGDGRVVLARYYRTPGPSSAPDADVTFGQGPTTSRNDVVAAAITPAGTVVDHGNCRSRPVLRAVYAGF